MCWVLHMLLQQILISSCSEAILHLHDMDSRCEHILPIDCWCLACVPVDKAKATCRVRLVLKVQGSDVCFEVSQSYLTPCQDGLVSLCAQHMSKCISIPVVRTNHLLERTQNRMRYAVVEIYDTVLVAQKSPGSQLYMAHVSKVDNGGRTVEVHQVVTHRTCLSRAAAVFYATDCSLLRAGKAYPAIPNHATCIQCLSSTVRCFEASKLCSVSVNVVNEACIRADSRLVSRVCDCRQRPMLPDSVLLGWSCKHRQV